MKKRSIITTRGYMGADPLDILIELESRNLLYVSDEEVAHNKQNKKEK